MSLKSLDYCTKSNGLVFFGSIGSGKTAILAMLAHELPSEESIIFFLVIYRELRKLK